MKTLKQYVIIVILFIVAICACKNLNKSESIMMVGSEVSLEKPWLEFNEADDSDIGNLIRAYKFDDGKKLFKKNIGENEILIACLTTENTWDFYYGNLKSREMMTLDDEIKQQITPPN